MQMTKNIKCPPINILFEFTVERRTNELKSVV